MKMKRPERDLPEMGITRVTMGLQGMIRNQRNQRLHMRIQASLVWGRELTNADVEEFVQVFEQQHIRVLLGTHDMPVHAVGPGEKRQG
jgi:diacylglycerol kinase